MSNITIDLKMEYDNDTGMVHVTRKVNGNATPISIVRMIIMGMKHLIDIVETIDPAENVSKITGEMKDGTKDKTTTT
jgi:hypothetical protein